MSRRRSVVIGGGIAGSAAALQLARAGNDVVLIERSPNLGGLVVSFEIAGTPLECFYHHVFPNESEMLALIGELGLSNRFEWFRSTVGVLRSDRIWPFTSPIDLLRFRPLPLFGRIRTGLAAVRLAGPDRPELDRIPAADWLREATGDHAMEEIWNPLLRFKFGAAQHTVPAAWMGGRFRQRASARSLRGERLGYLRGGFRQLFDGLAKELASLGVDIRLQAGVQRILTTDTRAAGVEIDNGEQIEADDVLYAGQLPNLAPLVPEEMRDDRWTAIGRLGAICIVLELDRRITNAYWTNVCDESIPFGALIEHTNLVGTQDYGGRHVVYLGRYFTAEDPVASADLDVLAKAWITALEGHLPTFDGKHVTAIHPFRTPYAAPLVTLGYREMIPPIRSHIDGLYVATTAQIYPEDRGMNEGIRIASRATTAMLDNP